MSNTRQEWAAQVLGMRTAEVVNVVSRGDVHLVTLHDRTRAVLDATGGFSFDEQAVDRFVLAVDDAHPVGERQGQVPPAGDPGTGDDVVPDGTAEAVLAWVGEDVDRARRALAAEGDRDKPRAGVTAKLTVLITPQVPPAGGGA
jgi:hypothetical protein